MGNANLNELWYDALMQITTNGKALDSRAGQTKEILGFQATLDDPLNNILLGYPMRKFSLPYACAEVLWYLTYSGDIKPMLQHYAPSYKKYCEDGIAYGAYGKRWKENPGFVLEDNNFFHPNGSNQLKLLITLLQEKPNTRQAILSMWDSGDLVHAYLGDHGDLPCTLSLKFYVRNGELHCIADMRSNDAWLGLPYDVFCFTTLQRIIADECGFKLGKYIHQAGSQHIYERNYEKVEQVLQNYTAKYPTALVYNHVDKDQDLDMKINLALDFEKDFRVNRGVGNNGRLDLFCQQSSVFKDLVSGTATKWVDMETDFQPDDFDNSLFAEWRKQELEAK